MVKLEIRRWDHLLQCLGQWEIMSHYCSGLGLPDGNQHSHRWVVWGRGSPLPMCNPDVLRRKILPQFERLLQF